jgi:hypothetical protein
MSENITTPAVTPAPKKKKHPVVGAVVGIVLIGAAVKMLTGHGDSTTTTAADDLHEVSYEVTGVGTNEADITVMTPDYGTSQSNGAALPLKNKTGETGLRYKFEDYHSVSLVAQNGNDSGSLTCTIKVDGHVLVTNTSSGAYAVVTCAGTVK